MDSKQVIIAGFGGQGVLFTGKLLAYVGLMQQKNVSWLPSYGPEMRGGTANCGVIISDDAIGSPIIAEPEYVIAMNLPSYKKYVSTVKCNGVIVADSTLIGEMTNQDTVSLIALPATQMAQEENLDGFSNIILLGKFMRECLPDAEMYFEDALKKVVSSRKASLAEKNKLAFSIGFAS